MSLAIKIENLGKKYIIGHQSNERYKTMRDALAGAFKKLISGGRSSDGSGFEEFWALDGICLEIKQGGRVGLIGRNGAGKSTLLKILSRITEPTAGRISLKGRVASLLEVGTGFHPELTGRENIFLNGAILGMSKAEIKKKFDEIVAFSEVEKFLDTPVKRFSSGMYVRLAFAVAAHMEPEILIVDEVLAVGDAQFQKKCLGKMEDVGREGRTVIFVSHNMAAIKSLCDEAVLLDCGRIVCGGPVSETVKKYEHGTLAAARSTPIAQMPRAHDLLLWARIVDVKILDEGGGEQAMLDSKKKFSVRMVIESEKDSNENICMGIIINDNEKKLVWAQSAYERKYYNLKKGVNTVECNFEQPNLTGGEYYLKCWMYSPMQQKSVDMVDNALQFTVGDLDPFDTGYPLTSSICVYNIPYTWQNLKHS